MSGAYVEVFTPAGELLGFSSYRGSSSTIDVCVWGTVEDAMAFYSGTMPREQWEARVATKESDRGCSHETEPVVIYSDYGAGDHWPGRFCRECMALVDSQPYEPDWGYSRPPDAEVERWWRWHAGGWPKDGHPFPAKDTA